MSNTSIQEKPVLLIDASIYIFQYYFSLPDNWFSEKEQWPTAAVYGYFTFLLRLLRDQQPNRIAACFDESLDQCFRNDIYPDYKSSRALPDEALAFQLNACRQVTDLLGIPTFSSERYEADDLLGCLYQICRRSKTPIAILTRDKDLGQLLQRPQDFLWDYAGDKCFYSTEIKEKFGVYPHQLVDYLALVGDSVDDIPGVPGVGPKTAQAILGYYGSIDALFNAGLESQTQKFKQLAIRGAKNLGQRLLEHREQIEIAQQLAKIVIDIPLVKSIKDITWTKPIAAKPLNKLERYCRAMGFPRVFTTVKSTLGVP